MRGCAYASGNGFYLFAKANFIGQWGIFLWLPLGCEAVRTRAHCRCAPEYRLRAHRLTPKLEVGARSVSVEQEVWMG